MTDKVAICNQYTRVLIKLATEFSLVFNVSIFSGHSLMYVLFGCAHGFFFFIVSCARSKSVESGANDCFSVYYPCDHTIANEPKVGIQLLLISYLLLESFVLASARILLLVSLLFCCCIVNTFDPYSL